MTFETKTFTLLKELTELQATSGSEDQVRTYIRDHIKDTVDDIRYDGLGGIFGLRPHKDINAPRVMLAAHMDEVGFMVKSIDDNGFISVVALGGWNMQVVSAQRFTLQTANGDYPVVSASIPPHLQGDGGHQSGLTIDTLRFDAGFASRDEAFAYGVKPGDSIVPEAETVKLAGGQRLLAKAVDNRYGVAVVIEALQALQGKDLPYTLIAGADVQEEVGLRGAKAAVNKFKPDLFIAVDASPADDLSGNPEAQGRLGDGFLLRVQDPGWMAPKQWRNFVEKVAQKYNIPFQYYFSKGGTDATAAQTQNNGIASLVIGVPARYAHTHQSILDAKDYQAARDVTIAILNELTVENIQQLTFH